MSTSKDPGFVLIVDDNPINLSVLSKMLEEAGLHFRAAANGESALALVERNRPDLILLDIRMPGIDGFETCRRLKENPATASIPVIFTTVDNNKNSKAKGFSMGAVDYIPQPFDQAEVLARVQVHLQMNRLMEFLEELVRDRTLALQQAQIQLIQREKLSSLGEMVAGVAHEMNNPINCIVNNIKPLKQYIGDITHILSLYRQENPHPSSQLKKAIEAQDLEFILRDITKILNVLTLSTEHIQNISTSLRTFSRSDSEEPVSTNLHECLDSTLMILQHRLKAHSDRPQIEVLKSYGTLPPIMCYAGQMNQVFMNILANAIDALEEAILQNQLLNSAPTIQIETYIASNQKVVIQITDNGIGVPDAIKRKLFEPLFTTKPVGKGTGLGLAISHQIIVEKHGGTLTVNSQEGQGATFAIEIPTGQNELSYES